MPAPTVYRGTVIKFESGQPLVEVPALGVGYLIGPCETTTGIVLQPGARVLCVSVSGIPEDVVVVGELDPAEVTLRLDFDAHVARFLTTISGVNFGSIAGGGVANQTVTVEGAAVGDSVALGPPAAVESGLLVFGRVTAADTVTLRAHNLNGTTLNPAGAQWRVTVIKPPAV